MNSNKIKVPLRNELIQARRASAARSEKRASPDLNARRANKNMCVRVRFAF
jgi:hypothetical protein